MAKEKILIDSSVLVSLYNPQDGQHQKAKRLIKSLAKKEVEFFIHPLVILEILTVLKQRGPAKVFKEVKEYLFNPTLYTLLKEKFFLQPDDFVFRIFEENKNISLVDAKLIEVAFLKNFTLLTLDKNLQKVAKRYKVAVLG